MTADIEMLPLPLTLRHPSDKDLADHVQTYARANVARAVAPLQAEVEALRAEVERVTCELMDATTRADKLAEALRECYEWLFESMSDGPRVSEGALTNGSYTRAFHDLHEKLHAVLHPTAAQENDDA